MKRRQQRTAQTTRSERVRAALVFGPLLIGQFTRRAFSWPPAHFELYELASLLPREYSYIDEHRRSGDTRRVPSLAPAMLIGRLIFEKNRGKLDSAQKS